MVYLLVFQQAFCCPCQLAPNLLFNSTTTFVQQFLFLVTMDNVAIFQVYLCRGEQIGLTGCDVPVLLSCFSTTFLNIVVEGMTSGLPQVCKPWLGISKDMLPVKHLAPKILIAFN